MLERWAQDGSTFVQIQDSTSSDHTIHTVTSGKTLYITSVVASEQSAGGDGWELKDASGGSVVLSIMDTGTKGVTLTLTFATPLKFVTEVYVNEIAASDTDITLTGWEE